MNALTTPSNCTFRQRVTNICTFLNCTNTISPKTEPAFDQYHCYTFGNSTQDNLI